jgi:acetylornithine deacetylase/succinyl-diaminopimelate desuccinylase-like protein
LPPPGKPREFGGLFSVALSLRSPSLAVSQHAALGVRTFLRGLRHAAAIARSALTDDFSVALLLDLDLADVVRHVGAQLADRPFPEGPELPGGLGRLVGGERVEGKPKPSMGRLHQAADPLASGILSPLMTHKLPALLALAALAASPALAGEPNLPPIEIRQLARALLAEQIAIPSTFENGTAEAARKLVDRFLAAGFAEPDVTLLAQTPKKVNLVVRLRGRGPGKAVLFLTHLDVVDVDRGEWSVEPYALTERDGYFYGRGTLDIKCEVADLAANLIRLHQEGFVPAHDILVAFTADEEAGGAETNGVRFLLAEHRELLDVAWVINTDAGGGQIEDGKRMRLPVQTAEKVYLSFEITARGSGGHSSMPSDDNAVLHLASALARLDGFRFPVELNPTTRAFFASLAKQHEGPLRQDLLAASAPQPDPAALERLSSNPFYNANLRTTCAATLLSASNAENALPVQASATLQCRLLPGDDPARVQAVIEERLADPAIRVRPTREPVLSEASPLDPQLLGAVESITGEMWPGVPVLPVMDVWSTDGARLRRAGLPVYGVTGLFFDIHDNRSHGADERILVDAFYESVEFMYRLMKRLSVDDR